MEKVREKKYSTLDKLEIGTKAKIAQIDIDKYRNFFDFGITNGVNIQALINSPYGGIRGYFIKGTVIAIRDEDAKKIKIEYLY
ncbi:MAG: FeoA family protein [Clostridia bacterium]|nr:FeoA family protein [Clostridia bacterium]